MYCMYIYIYEYITGSFHMVTIYYPLEETGMYIQVNGNPWGSVVLMEIY